MTYKKKDLEAVKRQLKQDPKYRARTKNTTRKIVKKEVKENFESKKTVIKWNYKVNDIVLCPYYNNQIGLIISDSKYFDMKVEKNYFFVLLGNKVIALNGQHLKKI